MEWRDQCDSTIRVATQILSRGTPKLGDELAEVSQAVLLGKMAPKAAAERLEMGLQAWYAPHQNMPEKEPSCQCVEATSNVMPADAMALQESQMSTLFEEASEASIEN